MRLKQNYMFDDDTYALNYIDRSVNTNYYDRNPGPLKMKRDKAFTNRVEKRRKRGK